jgi:hypothetical protein
MRQFVSPMTATHRPISHLTKGKGNAGSAVMVEKYLGIQNACHNVRQSIQPLKRKMSETQPGRHTDEQSPFVSDRGRRSLIGSKIVNEIVGRY